MVVVCWPSPEFSEISPVSTSSPGIRALVRDDLPTPDWPTKMLILSVSAALRASMPSPPRSSPAAPRNRACGRSRRAGARYGAGRIIEHVDLVQHHEGAISTSSAATR